MRRLLAAAGAAATLLAASCAVVGGPAPGPQQPDPRPQAPPVGPVPTRPPIARPAEPARRPVERPLQMPLPTFEEVRALWVVRYTMTSADAIDRLVEHAAASGFNTLIVQVRGRGDAYYRSRWEPRAAGLTDPDLDPLARVIERAHARGMAVHAWVNTHLVAEPDVVPASPDHVVNRNPDWLAVPAELGRRLYPVDPREPRYLAALMNDAMENEATVEGLYTSPSHPAVKERVYAVWMDILERYDVDGIHFDYIRLPSPRYDYSAGALRRFREWVAPRLPPERLAALDAAAASDPYALVEALPGPWGEFRRIHIDELVERIYHGVKARRPEVVVSAAVRPSIPEAYRDRFQDWPRWLAAGVLDVVVPMAYTTNDQTFAEQIRAARAAAGRRERVWAGIGAYLNTFQGTLSKIDHARAEGAGGVVLFSYDWAVADGPATGPVPYLERVGRAAFER